MKWTYEVNGVWDNEEFATREEAIEHGELNNEGTFSIGQVKDAGYLEQEITNVEEV